MSLVNTTDLGSILNASDVISHDTVELRDDSMGQLKTKSDILREYFERKR